MRRTVSIAPIIAFCLASFFAMATYLHQGSPRQAVQSIHPLGHLIKSTPDIAYTTSKSASQSHPNPSPVVPRHSVQRVLDGDTLVLVPQEPKAAPVTVRLASIDAPESKQPGGIASAQHLASLVHNRTITVRPKEFDRYGRLVAWIEADGIDVNLAMLQAGHAWHFQKYDSNPAYAKAQQAAQEAHRGLWKQPRPVPPWEWRKQ